MKLLIVGMAIFLTACASNEYKEKIYGWEKFRKENNCKLYQDSFTVPGGKTTKPLFICNGNVYERPF